MRFTAKLDAFLTGGDSPRPEELYPTIVSLEPHSLNISFIHVLAMCRPLSSFIGVERALYISPS